MTIDEGEIKAGSVWESAQFIFTPVRVWGNCAVWDCLILYNQHSELVGTVQPCSASSIKAWFKRVV